MTALSLKFSQWLNASQGDTGDTGGAWGISLKILCAGWAALLLLFWRDAADMAVIWWNSSTFNHCLLILPILYWLVHQRRELLLQLKPQSWGLALLYLAAGAAAWLLGEAAGLAVARQLGLIMMLQAMAASVLGKNVTRGVLFPMFYMFFLLPLGEEAVPALQTITAKMCMLFLDITGIPAYIDGIFISTPTGYFKVAEACSGVKFLIAMVAYGALVANLCFKSWVRRAAFMAACIIVPIIANGLRAFGTIYVAHHSGIAFASGFDHVFYGWIFFAIVIALVMAAGWRFFDKSADDPAFDVAQLQTQFPQKFSSVSILIAGIVISVLPLVWTAIVAAQAAPLPKDIALPSVTYWQSIPYQPQYAWKPRFDGADRNLIGRYRNASGQNVDVFVAVYNSQSDGRELIGFGQGAADPDSEWAWTANISAPKNAKAERITAPGKAVRDVISFYRVNGVTSGASSAIKLATLRARLFGGDQQAVAILVSTEHVGDTNPRLVIDEFMRDFGNVDNLADQMVGLR
jgi:exosortase A